MKRETGKMDNQGRKSRKVMMNDTMKDENIDQEKCAAAIREGMLGETHTRVMEQGVNVRR